MGETIRQLVRAGGKWYIRWPVRAAVVIVLFIVANLPYAHEISGECRVVPAEQYGARAQVAAEIVGIHAKEGDLVEAGGILATLTDRNVGTDVALEPFDVIYVPMSGIAKVDKFVDQYIRQLIPVALNAGFTYILGGSAVVLPAQ